MTLNANWSKASGEARTEEYRAWRTRLGVGAVADVDQVEYAWGDGRPLVTIELCVADRRSEQYPAGIPPGRAPSPGFFAAVEAKVSAERPQGRVTQRIADALEVPVWLVVFIKGELETAGVWVKRLDAPEQGWEALTLEGYAEQLRALHAQAPVIAEPPAVPEAVPVDASDEPEPHSVTFRSGLTVPVAALRFGLALEARGAKFDVDGNGLSVKPWALLTPEDKAGLQRWHRHLAAMLEMGEADHAHRG